MSENGELMPADKVARNALVADVEELLGQCSPEQSALFDRLYPEGVGGLDMERLRNAHGLCRRTVASNRAGVDR